MHPVNRWPLLTQGSVTLCGLPGFGDGSGTGYGDGHTGGYRSFGAGFGYLDGDGIGTAYGFKDGDGCGYDYGYGNGDGG